MSAGEEARAWDPAGSIPDREGACAADHALLLLLLLLLDEASAWTKDSAWWLAEFRNGVADVECDVDAAPAAAACMAAFRSARWAARFARRASTSLLSSGVGDGGSCARARSKCGIHVIKRTGNQRESEDGSRAEQASRQGQGKRIWLRLRPYQVGQLLVELGKLDQHICQFRLPVRQPVHHLCMLNIFVKVVATLRRGGREQLWVSDRRLSLLCWTRGCSHRASNY